MGHWPIVGFVGPNGGGKTCGMVVNMAVPAMKRRLPILANFRIHYDLWEPLTNWQQVLDFHDGLILLDEVSSWIPSRESSKLPAQVVSDIGQMRKANRTIAWAGPAWGRCDIALRQVTQAVCWSRGFAADSWQRERGGVHPFPFTGPRKRGEDGNGRALRVEGWEDRRLFRWQWFDPYEIPEDATAQQLERPPKECRPKATKWYWRPGHSEMNLYNSKERVLMLDTVDPSGACLSCGGARARKKCECDRRNAEVLA